MKIPPCLIGRRVLQISWGLRNQKSCIFRSEFRIFVTSAKQNISQYFSVTNLTNLGVQAYRYRENTQLSAPLPIGYIFPITVVLIVQPTSACREERNVDGAMCFLILQSWRAHPQEGFFVFLCKCIKPEVLDLSPGPGSPPSIQTHSPVYIASTQKLLLTHFLSPKIYVKETVRRAQVWTIGAMDRTSGQ